jgi:hypothetical protein
MGAIRLARVEGEPEALKGVVGFLVGHLADLTH